MIHSLRWQRCVLISLIILAAGCTQDASVDEATEETCIGESMILTWTGTQLGVAAYGAIDLYEAGELEASQESYDTAAQVMDELPALAAALNERCSAHIPEQVAAMNDSVESAQTRWEELQSGCRAGPGLHGFRCG